MQPRIIVNAKVYAQVTGPDGIIALARACQSVASDSGVPVGLAPPMVELATIGRLEDIPDVHVYAQHVDPLPPGAGTGWTTVAAIKAAGARGTILNHAEHKLDDVAPAASAAASAGLTTLLCADSLAECRSLAALRPTFIAVEPPQLIGGDVSVTSADPAIVRDAAEAITEGSPDTLPLCGAGVKNGRDVAAAIDLGAYGVLLASGVVKATDPLAVLQDLASGL